MFALPIAAVAAIVYGVYALLRKDPLRRARFLQREAVALGLLLGLLWILFAFGELFADRPVTEAWAWTIAAVVPALLASWFAVRFASGFRPWAIGIVVAAAVAVLVTIILGSEWRAFVDEHGPVLVVACLVASIPLELWGMQRSAESGVLLVALALVGMLSGPSVSGQALMSPPLAAGAMLVIAGRMLAASTPRDSRAAG